MAGSYIQVHGKPPSRASNPLGCFSFPPSFSESFHREIFTCYEFRQNTVHLLMLTMRILMLYVRLRIHRKMWALFIALLEEESITLFCTSCKIPMHEHMHKPFT